MYICDMARPKKQVEEPQGGETTTETKITEVKIEKTEPKKLELKVKDAFLVKINGADKYFTKTQLDVMFQRNSHSIEIPKGSSYIVPANSKCVNCG